MSLYTYAVKDHTDEMYLLYYIILYYTLIIMSALRYI